MRFISTGGRLGLNHARMCVCSKVKEINGFFFGYNLQVNEMNEVMSFKMGAKFATSFYMG